MKVKAYQESGLEAAVTRRKEGRDSVTVDFALDSDLNIVSVSSITKGFYIGGLERGYDVRITLTKSDILELIKLLDTAEVDDTEKLLRKRDYLKAIREQKIVDERLHQSKLEKRRKAYARRKKKLADSGKCD